MGRQDFVSQGKRKKHPFILTALPRFLRRYQKIDHVSRLFLLVRRHSLGGPISSVTDAAPFFLRGSTPSPGPFALRKTQRQDPINQREKTQNYENAITESNFRAFLDPDAACCHKLKISESVGGTYEHSDIFPHWQAVRDRSYGGGLPAAKFCKDIKKTDEPTKSLDVVKTFTFFSLSPTLSPRTPELTRM